MQVLKLKIDFSSISVQLLVLVLIITIVPIVILTYSNDRTLTEFKDEQLQAKIHDSSIMVSQAYQTMMEDEHLAAVELSRDPGLEYAVMEGNRTAVKAIVDDYCLNDTVNYIITVVDASGMVMARSSNNQSGDYTMNTRLLAALEGNGSTVTDILPAQVIIANQLWDKVNATGMSDGLSLISTEPVRDNRRQVVGAVSISGVLNGNFEMVDTITNQTGVYCTIFQNDTRIATTLTDAGNNRIVGTKALPEIANAVIFGQRTVEGPYVINNMSLYAHYEPIFNDRRETVGMLFVGYDAGPQLAALNQLREQAIATGVIASIVFVIIGYLLVRTITRPIKRIVAVANSIASGNLDTPVDTEGGGGEIEELSVAIRKMVRYMVTNIKERINYNESILKGISDPMLVVDNNGRITFFNGPASALTGYAPEEAIGWRYTDVLKAGSSPEAMPVDIRKSEVVRGFEDTITSRDGRKAIVRGTSALLKDAGGNIIGAIVLLHDITREKEADERIKASLKEKEVLLKEIHHRVKNNLQIISSLLNLQSTYIRDPQALGMFKESQNRVRSMALIHEKLYQSEDISRIDFSEYIKNLAGNLIRSYGASPAQVRLAIDTERISLGVDTAIPCGLIINELVTNSLKYAFTGGQKGEIRISLRHEETNDRYCLTVADNGAGLPASVDPRRTSTLGLQLVSTLTDQLNGTIDVRRENGTEFAIRFSEIKTREN